MINQLLELLNQGWVGSLLGIIGLIATFLTIENSQKRKALAYDIKTVHLIKDFQYQINELKILYKDKEIKNLSVSLILIWNDGKEVIRKSDLAEGDPIRLCLYHGEFIDKALLSHSEERNQIKMRLKSSNELLLSFEYLSRGDKAVIQVFHSGLTDLKGSIIGSFDEPIRKQPGSSLVISLARIVWIYIPLLTSILLHSNFMRVSKFFINNFPVFVVDSIFFNFYTLYFLIVCLLPFVIFAIICQNFPFGKYNAFLDGVGEKYLGIVHWPDDAGESVFGKSLSRSVFRLH
ncbi:hypothetical protein [Nodosilinea sp. E11]|uniref:hypothetical protein n=1 Tax=Nodosilinea sp. E11 TaxID=3037479 RepID=UPI00293456E3|nr:hypothetical protein [Nodosilinea sp. E11]WOD40034.1 hypothetical protein RRF56_04435 [Nodosilinea sp. E11]